MFCFLRKTILQWRPNEFKAFKTYHLLYIFRNNPSFSFSPKSIATIANQQSFTVSCLIKKLWVIPRIRHFSLRHRLVEEPWILENPSATLIKKRPCVLASDVEKTLLPKITFLNSKGISSSDLAKFLSKCPSLLILSLENRIIPSFNFLSNLLQSNNDILGVLNLFPRMLLYDFGSYILPKSNVLRQNGVPDLNIVKGFRRVPKTFFYTPIQFKENVEKVKQMGFNPERFTFILAVTVLGSMSKSTWETKFDVYKKCGWSEEEILDAFKNHPWVMAASEGRIKALMDFLVNVMGFKASLVTKQPYLLGLSMEKRIVPRGLFVKDLISKGLLAKVSGLTTLFASSEKVFLLRFVYCYEEKASELLKLYNEKLNLAAGEKLKTPKLWNIC